jgi:hypothetical protein
MWRMALPRYVLGTLPAIGQCYRVDRRGKVLFTVLSYNPGRLAVRVGPVVETFRGSITSLYESLRAAGNLR